MNNTLVLNSNIIKNNIKVNKREVISQIKKQVEVTKLELLKISLKDNDIAFDNSIMEYHTFINDTRKKLVGHDLALFNTLVNNIDKSISDMIDKLDKGSTSAFTEFVSKSYQKVIQPVGNMVANSLALNTVLSLIPTVEGKAIASVILTSLSVYNIAKLDKYKRMSNKVYELNKILQELECTKDKDNNFVDTRFGVSIQNSIRDFLRENNIIFDDTGYLSLRDIIYKLDNDKKEQLCKIISNMKGNVIDVDDRLKEVNQNILTRANNKYFKGIALGFTTGTMAATTINGIDPSLLAAPLNGTIIGEIVSKLSNSKVLGWISGIASSGLSFIGKYIPVIGKSVQKILSIENLGVLAITGAGVGLLLSIGKNVVDAIKNRKKRFDTQQNMKQLQELDTKLYGNGDIAEIQKIKNILASKTVNEEAFVVNMVCQYMDELGISYGHKPTNYSELDNIINSLSNVDKKKVNDLTSSLKNYLNRDPNTFRRVMKKVANIVKTVVTLGLASMSIVNIFSAGAFFESVKNKLFNTGKDVIPPKMGAFDDSNGIKAYDEAHPNINKEVVPRESHTVKDMPSATPAPTTMETKEVISQKVEIPRATSVVTHHGSDGVGYVVTIPKISIDTITADPTNHQDLIAQLSTLTDQELFDVMANGHDPVYMLKGLKLLKKDDLLRLRTFMETSDLINRQNSIGYKFLKDAFKNYISEYNVSIDPLINEINAKTSALNTADTIAKGVVIPVGVISDYEESKVKAIKR